MLERRKRITAALHRLRDCELIVRPPLRIEGRPFRFGEFVSFGRGAVVLAGADEVLGVVTACQVPVGA